MGLSEVPREVFSLRSLQELDLSFNSLGELPSDIQKLSSLTALDLTANNLEELPNEISNLQRLQTLSIGSNSLSTLPTNIGNLRELSLLHIWGNQLSDLPDTFSALSNLRHLDLSSNRLDTLPDCLIGLPNLIDVNISGNDLRSPLAELAERGSKTVASYLRSLADGEIVSEGRLMIVGEGNVGKSSLLAALQGAPFVEKRPTTHGLEIGRLDLMVPGQERSIVLNVWDFGGQDVYRVTHQFFFSRRALFVLVWRPREGAEQNEVLGWMKRIRLRIGSQARVLVVATHCDSDQRVARLDRDGLRKDFGDMIVDFFEVDNLTKTGIDALRTSIATSGARLPQVGQRISKRWLAAIQQIKNLRRELPHIPTTIFSSICDENGLLDEEGRTLANLMHDLGHIVHYSDDDGLRDIVVLQPEWLTKAISFVLEDRETNARHGLLEHGRLRTIWSDHRIPDRQTYPTGVHPFFLRLMEKFDVSYRIPAADGEPARRSLVAQLVPYARPVLPWEPTQTTTADERQLTLIFDLDEPPPGLIAWFTVRTDRFSTDRHWQTGVFLDYGDHGTALVELLRKELHVHVRSAWPSYFLDLLRDTIDHLLRERWPGLTFKVQVPCPGMATGEQECPERYELSGLIDLISDGRSTHRCLKCRTDLDVQRLVAGYGVSTLPAATLIARRVAEELQPRFDTASAERRSIASQGAEHVKAILQSIGTDSQYGPGLFSLIPERLSWWNPANIGHQGFILTLWCEHLDQVHPCCALGEGGPGEYKFKRPKAWLAAVAPYVSVVSKVLRASIPIGGAVAKVLMDESPFKEIEPKLNLMEKCSSEFLKDSDKNEVVKSLAPQPLNLAVGAARRELEYLLDKVDPERHWGGLRRFRVVSGEYRWICPVHIQSYDPGLPNIPE